MLADGARRHSGRAMPIFTVEDIVRGTQGALVGGDLGVPVTGVSIDTRTLVVGRGVLRHRRARSATATRSWTMRPRAARPVSSCRALPDDLRSSTPIVLVDDTTRALGRLAAYHRARFTRARRGGDRLERQDHDEGDDGVGARRARAGAEARVELQQPVGPAADAVQAGPASTARRRSSSAPISPARSRRSRRSAARPWASSPSWPPRTPSSSARSRACRRRRARWCARSRRRAPSS